MIFEVDNSMEKDFPKKIIVAELIKKIRLLWNQKVRYSVYKMAPPAKILSQFNIVNTFTSNF